MFQIVYTSRCAYGTAENQDRDDMVPVEGPVGKNNIIYPIMRVSRWQLHQPPKPESVPAAAELNSDSEWEHHYYNSDNQIVPIEHIVF